MTQPKPNIISRDTPVETARLFREQRHRNMVSYHKDWLDWNGSAYELIENDTIESELLLWLNECKSLVAYDATDENGETVRKFKHEPFHPKDNDVNQVNVTMFRLYHIKPGSMDPPYFLAGDLTGDYDGLDPANIISCKNGLLDITTRTMYPATPLFFTRTALPIDYNPGAECPLFRAFLFQVLADDQLVLLMQQWFGYLITTDVSIQKLLYMQGVPRSGKGTTARVIDALVGKRNVASHTINDLAGNFGREGLIGKSLLKITDANIDNKQSFTQAASIVNGIVGQDPMHVGRKFKGALDIEPKTHVVIIGNGFPDFGDHTAAIAARLSGIPFRVSFEGREDTELTAKLLTELPGILNYALDGLDSLRQTGKFMIVEASENLKRQIVNSGNPVRGFIHDRCEVGPDFKISKTDIFDAYTDYCIRIRAHPLSSNKFYTALKTAETSLQEIRPWADGVDRERFMTGIRLRELGPPTTITKTFWLDQNLVGLVEPEHAILIDPITREPVEVIDNEFSGGGD